VPAFKFILAAVIICVAFPLSAEPVYSENAEIIAEPVLTEEPAVIEITSAAQEASQSEEDYDDYLFFENAALVIEASPVIEMRSFTDIFPNFSLSLRRRAMSGMGLRRSYESNDIPMYLPSSSSGINLLSSVMEKNPTHIIEALIVVPYNKKEFDLLDIYNAMGRIELIKEQTLPLRDGSEYSVFKNTTRLESGERRRVITDPPPASVLPYSETIYVRFTDRNIGHVFLRGDISFSLYGMTYNMTNFRDINFSIFRIMQAEKVIITIYLEPVKEGILIYSLSGLSLPGFIVSRMNLTPNINARITVLLNWIKEGLRRQETPPQETENNSLLEQFIQNNSLDNLLNN